MKRNQQSLEFLCFKQEQELFDPMLYPLRKSESHPERFACNPQENQADKNEAEV